MEHPIDIRAFFDEGTSTLTYVVSDPDTCDAVIIDPVLSYEPRGSTTSCGGIHAVVEHVVAANLRVHWVLETHAHADHLSGAQIVKRGFDAPVAIGAAITTVQATFKDLFDLRDTFRTDGSQFDKLIEDGEKLRAGSLVIEAIATPGHTPACMSYRIGDAVFTGDALFMHDYGTGRADFPKGCARDLYHSIHERLYALPDATRVFVGHDYQPGGRELRYETTIGLSKRHNPQLSSDTTQEEFVAFRNARDATLAAPRLLYSSVQVNIDAGRLPKRRDNGRQYLTIPINLFADADELGAPRSNTEESS